MSNPLVHAERSVTKWGGTPDEYLEIHKWFDSTKGHLADNRHRMILHNSFGVLLAEQVFGSAITLSTGRRVFVRDIACQHITEDLGFVPTVEECLRTLPLVPWMAGVRPKKAGDGKESDQVQEGGAVNVAGAEASGADSAGERASRSGQNDADAVTRKDAE